MYKFVYTNHCYTPLTQSVSCKEVGLMPVDIFFSYAHEDEEFLNKIKTHLIPLYREGLIDLLWHDRNISAGTEWERQIDTYLNKAQIILLLISPDFMASDYCISKEMKRALERHEQGNARVIPVILRHSQWKRSPIGKLQAIPTDGKPIRSWPDEDEALFNVVDGIRKAIEELKAREEITASVSSTKAVEVTSTTFIPSDEPDQKVIVVDNLPPQNPQPIADAASQQASATATSGVTTSPQLLQNQDNLQEIFAKYRVKLAEMEETIDTGAASEVTVDFAVQLHILLRQIISTIRDLPQEASNKSSREYFESEDDVFENIRQARIQVMMALNSLKPALLGLLFQDNRTETFYQYLLSCREYLERALKQW